jgi:hypothetical protein
VVTIINNSNSSQPFQQELKLFNRTNELVFLEQVLRTPLTKASTDDPDRSNPLWIPFSIESRMKCTVIPALKRGARKRDKAITDNFLNRIINTRN